MNLRTFALPLILVFALLLLLVTLNWPAVSAPTTLYLGLTDVQAPLGVVMLGFTAVISAVFVVFILFQQAGVILEARRLAKDLRAQRELADTAEASRFTELRALLESEIRRVDAQRQAADRDLLDKLAEATHSTAAHLGEIEDKLDRVLAMSAR